MAGSGDMMEESISTLCDQKLFREESKGFSGERRRQKCAESGPQKKLL